MLVVDTSITRRARFRGGTVARLRRRSCLGLSSGEFGPLWWCERSDLGLIFGV